MSEVQQEQIQESQHEHHHEHHEHGSHHRHKSKLKPVLYTVLSFFLAFVLSLLSVCIVVTCTIFSSDYMIDTMRTNGYHEMVKSELQTDLEDLVDASGFEKQFVDSFVKKLDIRKAVEEYIASFYTGSSTLVETTSFKQKLYSAIEEYIQEKKITVSDETKGNIAYFVNEVADIYVTQISIPFFSTIANYIYKARSILNIVFISLSIVALVIAGIIFFTNEFKHRRFRYLFLGTTGAALTVLILPTVVLLSNKITKVNLVTRSLYTLFVNYFNGVFYSFYIWAGILVALSVVFMFLYVKHYRRVVH